MAHEDPFGFDNYDVAFVATAPEPVKPSTITDVEQVTQPAAITISTTQRLTWQGYNLAGKFKELRINKYVQEWMADNTAFRNWIYTIMSAHLALNPLDDICYPLPDQFKEEYGIESITFETFSQEALNVRTAGGKREKPDLSKAVIHILI